MKEGFIAGTDIPLDDDRVVNRRFFVGENVWPPNDLLATGDFSKPVEEYYRAMLKLCWIVLDLVAATLPFGPNVFDEVKSNDPACPLRLLHYPTMAGSAACGKRQLGIGAHTDFGAVTLLLQDHHDGLEVLDRNTGE